MSALEKAMMEDTKPSCTQCGGTEWRYNVTYTTILDNTVVPRHQSHEELRCARCGKKAVKEVEETIRNTEGFFQARLVEEACSGCQGGRLRDA